MTNKSDGSLTGFALTLSGETEDEFAMPSSLQLPGLGEHLSGRINVEKFTMPRYSLQMTFKCVQRLVESDDLVFLDADQVGPSGASSKPVITHDESIAALKSRPLARHHEGRGQHPKHVIAASHRFST